MKNVLRKRYLREFRSDFYKFFVIFFIMILMIGEASGFLIADEGLIQTYDESFTKYNIEDGNFRTAYRLDEEEVERVERLGVTLYENFAREVKVKTYPSEKPRGEHPKNELKLRIFQNREAVNLACIMEGSLPKQPSEMAMDRTVANNKGLKIGDRVKEEKGDRNYKITGLVALADYSSMFERNHEPVFDSSGFGVAVVSEKEFENYTEEKHKYIYSFKYLEEPKDKKEEKRRGDELVKELSKFIEIEEFLPAYLNQAITFSGNDFTSDRAMIRVFLYGVLAIVSFIFAINIQNTINKEAEVIGTLLASGYRKWEITHHYMVVPVIVTLVSAVIGNILGYTWFKGVNAKLYYDSYSLPKMEEVWSLNALIETTLVPLVIMVAITYFSIRRKLSLSPLKFLTHDLSKRRRKKGVRLSIKIPFFERFRLRVIFQNVGNYIMLFIGVLFAYFILMFGLVFPVMLDHYEENLKTNQLAEYQYLLTVSPKLSKTPERLVGLFTKEEEAEKFSMRSLLTDESLGKEEDIMVYGIEENSRYVKIQEEKNFVAISRQIADKFSIQVGDELILHEKYEDKSYRWKVTEISDYEGSLAIFIDRKRANELFGMEKEFFSGYFSNKKLEDIDEAFIGTIIDYEVMTKISRQMKISMGGLMKIVNLIGMIIFGMMIYLLTKTIIEKNSSSISMAKIMGYTNREINRLYIGATTMVMIVFLVIGIPIIKGIMEQVFRFLFRTRMKGWIPVHITLKEEVAMFFMGFVTYVLVSLIEFRRIKKVPMDEVLKNAE